MHRSVRLAGFLAAIMLVGAGCFTSTVPAEPTAEDLVPVEIPVNDKKPVTEEKTYESPGTLPAEEITGKQIRISTEKGDIVFELYPDTAPLAVSNFVYLAGEGYYDGVVFHRIVPGFVIQGGDPTGTGRGGPGYKFEDELDDERTYDRGIVAMANAGPGTNGSQFFIMLEDFQTESMTTPNYIDKNYTIFGRVLEGMDIVDQIVEGDQMASVTIEDAE